MRRRRIKASISRSQADLSRSSGREIPSGKSPASEKWQTANIYKSIPQARRNRSIISALGDTLLFSMLLRCTKEMPSSFAALLSDSPSRVRSSLAASQRFIIILSSKCKRERDVMSKWSQRFYKLPRRSGVPHNVCRPVILMPNNLLRAASIRQ